MKKALFLMLGVISLFLMTSVNTKADEVEKVNASYDLTVGGTQTFDNVDSNREEIEITVSEENTSPLLANKAYTASKKGSGWNLSYKINVNNNKITSAYGLNAVATAGSFTSSSLNKISNTIAQWKGVHKRGLLSNNVSCTATISGGSLQVT